MAADDIPVVFEGVEKRIELSFVSTEESPASGLRTIERCIWDEVCAKCKCEIVNHKELPGFDSYILSESSLFVFPLRVVMKTCGTTVPLNGIDLIVRNACEVGLIPLEMTYSRTSFMFPDLQLFPHNSLENELKFLDDMQINGCVVPGKSSILGDPCGKYWLVHRKAFHSDEPMVEVRTPEHRGSDISLNPRVTVDIIMTGLCSKVCDQFFKDLDKPDCENEKRMRNCISDILPEFSDIIGKTYHPCGYSANGHEPQGMHDDRCFTVHVTPEEEFSYASFEAVFYPSLARDTSGEFCLDSDHKLKCEIEGFVGRTLSKFGPAQALVTIMSGDHSLSAAMLPQSLCAKQRKLKFPELFSSDNLLGEDIVASSIYYSGVSSGNTGTKPTGLS
jgi:S-adenosylmethionine decarboxylase